MARLSVTIAGTGAMACLFGARLSSHVDVTLLGTWPEGLAALQAGGIRIVEGDGSERTCSVRATSNPGDCAGTKMALVLVKSWQTLRTARQLAVCMQPDGVALTLQNGLGNLEILQEALGLERATLGVTMMGATLLGPGHVRAGGDGPTHVAFHQRLHPLIEVLRQAGFKLEMAENLESLAWGKLAINAAINPLTALLGIPNGELLSRPHALALMADAAEETSAVATAQGISLPYPEPGTAAVEVAGRTASNHSSMLQDIQRGAPTEIDAISGAIAHKGESFGVPTPVNRTLWHLVRALAASDPGVDV